MLLDAFYGAKNKVCNHCTLYFLLYRGQVLRALHYNLN